MEKKDKYLGFRITYSDYMTTLEKAGRLGISVSDFILSALLPKINKVDVEPFVKQENNVKKTANYLEPLLLKEQNEIQYKSKNESLTEIEEKIKKYNYKLKTI